MSFKEADKISQKKLLSMLEDEQSKPGGSLLVAALCLAEMVNRGAKPLSELHDFLKEHPDLFDDRSFLGSNIRAGLIQNLMGDRQGNAALLSHEYDRMAEQLREQGDSPLERLLITRVCLSWLRLQAAEALANQSMKHTTLAQAEHAARDLTRAQPDSLKPPNRLSECEQ